MERRDLPCSWIFKINIVKMAIWPKAIYKFNTIPIKSPTQFFTNLKGRYTTSMKKQKNKNKKIQDSQTILWLKKISSRTAELQNSMAEKQTGESMESNWRSKHTSTHLWIPDFWLRSPEENIFNQWCWQNWMWAYRKMQINP